MNDRQLYGRPNREGKPHKIRTKLNNNRRIEKELDAETRAYLENIHNRDSINSEDFYLDYNLIIKNKYYN